MSLSVALALVTVWTGIVVSYQTNWPLGFFVGVMGAAFFLLGRAYAAARRQMTVRASAATPLGRSPVDHRASASRSRWQRTGSSVKP
jgi:uncharacterized membrane protein